MRILAVDYGTKRIGLATGDEQTRMIRAFKTLFAEGVKRDAHRLLKCAQELGAEKILIGQPRGHSETVNSMARRAAKLAAQLQRLSSFTILLWDEHLTSKAADEWMVSHGVNPSQRAAVRDQIAACLILEDFFSIVSNPIASEKV